MNGFRLVSLQAKQALKSIKYYKHVVHVVEKWIRKGQPGALPLFVIGTAASERAPQYTGSFVTDNF
jgi:hypothetical protein